jgi:hypothetical protein
MSQSNLTIQKVATCIDWWYPLVSSNMAMGLSSPRWMTRVTVTKMICCPHGISNWESKGNNSECVLWFSGVQQIQDDQCDCHCSKMGPGRLGETPRHVTAGHLRHIVHVAQSLPWFRPAESGPWMCMVFLCNSKDGTLRCPQTLAGHRVSPHIGGFVRWVNVGKSSYRCKVMPAFLCVGYPLVI